MVIAYMPTFTISETNGLLRNCEIASASVPVTKGALSGSPDEIEIIDSLSREIVENTNIDVVAHWADGTARWIVVQFTVSVKPYESLSYELVSSNDASLTQGMAAHRESIETSRDLPNERCIFTTEQSSVKIIDTLAGEQHPIELAVYVVDLAGKRHQLEIGEQLVDCASRSQKKSSVSWLVSPSHARQGVYVTLTINMLQPINTFDVELCIQNSLCAKHADGLWDLGDPASFLFNELGLELSIPPPIDCVDSCHLAVLRDGTIFSQHVGEEFKVSQTSSGGENYKSTVHINSAGKLPEMSQGYQITQNDEILEAGRRATPIGILTMRNSEQLCVFPHRFWQEFPTTLQLQAGMARTTFYSQLNNNEYHELQPGEQKRRSLSISICTLQDSPSCWLTLPHRVQGIPVNSETMPRHLFLRVLTLSASIEQKLNDLIVGPEEYHLKRELIDEYGWRNYGDLFADHESLYTAEKGELLVSHYNNQYDPVLGFGLQYLRTRDIQWFDLMCDLARHVVDIDIYHTNDDRHEYNQGLFWHTNHYVDAATSSHRTHSRDNFDPKVPMSSSGGPSDEHCYTTGLLLHYWLTGDMKSRASVLTLAKWIFDLFDGDMTLLGRIHSVAKIEMRTIKDIILGNEPLGYRYPFSRGTGNLVTALLDSWSLTGDRQWITKVEAVLRNTFHPADDASRRELEKVELRWSHTILLQAVLQYLSIKEELNEYDIAYWHARQSFLCYTHWTLTHGVPYLKMGSEIEFPNDTWAAQDIRRYILMCAAAAYDVKLRSEYMRKAYLFGTHIVSQLSKSKSVNHTRIQAILMQNMGIASYFESRHGLGDVQISSDIQIPPRYSPTVIGQLKSACKKIWAGILQIKLSEEIRWLRTRL